MTGGNRGIGLEVCRQLAAAGLRVVLASRELEAGKQAAAGLGAEVLVEQLDAAVQDLRDSFEVNFRRRAHRRKARARSSGWRPCPKADPPKACSATRPPPPGSLATPNPQHLNG